MGYIALRNERVGIGELTFDLVQGEPVPDGLSDEVLASLSAAELILDVEATTTDNPNGPEARAGATVVAPPEVHVLHPGEGENAITPDSPPADPPTDPVAGELPGQVASTEAAPVPSPDPPPEGA